MTGALLGYYEGDVLLIRYAASVAPDGLDATLFYETPDKPGKPYVESVPQVTSFTTDRSIVLVTGDPVGGSGAPGCNVTGGGMTLKATTADVKRGQFYARFIVRRGLGQLEECLCCGYLYSARPYLTIGQHEEPGPGGGEGFLSWISVATNVAGNAAESTLTLGVANTIRKYRGYILMMVTDANAATRTIEIDVRAPSDMAVPTGFGGRGFIHTGPALTLTLSQVGTIYVGDFPYAYMAVNDNGVLSVSNNTTAPHPFPITAVEGDLGVLTTTKTGGLAGDLYSFSVLTEEWLVV